LAAYTTNWSFTETHAAVTIPLCNLNGNPGLLLEVKGKVRTRSGEVTCAFFFVLLSPFTQDC